MRDPQALAHARTMRREPTPAEHRLWLALRATRFHGLKFRQQKVIGHVIADFACRNPMLVIEVDGDTHDIECPRDAARTRFLESQGYRVIRFTNRDVMGNLEGVLRALALAIEDMPLSTAPNQQAGRASYLSPEGERVRPSSLPFRGEIRSLMSEAN